MAMTINTNIAALNAQSNLNGLKTFEKQHKMKSEAFLKHSRPANLVTMQSGSIGSMYMKPTIE